MWKSSKLNEVLLWSIFTLHRNFIWFGQTKLKLFCKMWKQKLSWIKSNYFGTHYGENLKIEKKTVSLSFPRFCKYYMKLGLSNFSYCPKCEQKILYTQNYVYFLLGPSNQLNPDLVSFVSLYSPQTGNHKLSIFAVQIKMQYKNH